jgi:hypothetical protein
MVADYNGWADLPEAEREALDFLELSPPVPSERPSHAPEVLPISVERTTSTEAPMPSSALQGFHVVGVTHRTASVGVRERLVLARPDAAAWLDEQRSAGRSAAILSSARSSLQLCPHHSCRHSDFVCPFFGGYTSRFNVWTRQAPA